MAVGSPRGRCAEPPSKQFLFGIEQFNRQEFFECHETLEEMWLAESDQVRYLYQGILQVGVGYLHLLRGNHHGAATKLHSGCALLEYFVPTCMGVDVSALLGAARAHVGDLLRLGPDRISDFDLATIPRISFSSPTGART
jgi:hypothetical protein